MITLLATSARWSFAQQYAILPAPFDSPFIADLPPLSKMGMRAWERQSVCAPREYVDTGPVILPCTSGARIDNACRPNGSQPIHFIASSQCLCSPPSSFFADWSACARCRYVHGEISEYDMNSSIMRFSAASTMYCTGTPDAMFHSSWDKATVSSVTGAITSSDQFPGNMAISLYYTPTGPQGIGDISCRFAYSCDRYLQG
jgi:hypothetical protein